MILVDVSIRDGADTRGIGFALFETSMKLNSAAVVLCFLLPALTVKCGPSTTFEEEKKSDVTKEKEREGPEAPSPEEEAEKEERSARLKQVVESLWESPLGELIHKYLTGSFEDPSDVTRYARTLSDKLMREGPNITNISALQLLIEDLYEKGKLTDEGNRRISILQTDMLATQVDTASYPGEGLFYSAVIGMIAALPFGSPLVRNAAKNLISYLAKGLNFQPVFQDIPRVPIRNLLSTQIVRDYSFRQAIGYFLQYFGPVTMAYFFWFDWKESAKDHPIQMQMAAIHDGKDWDDFLKRMRSL